MIQCIIYMIDHYCVLYSWSKRFVLFSIWLVCYFIQVCKGEDLSGRSPMVGPLTGHKFSLFSTFSVRLVQASLRVNEMAVALPLSHQATALPSKSSTGSPGRPGQVSNTGMHLWDKWHIFALYYPHGMIMYHHGIFIESSPFRSMPPLRSADGWEVDQRGRWWHWQFLVFDPDHWPSKKDLPWPVQISNVDLFKSCKILWTVSWNSIPQFLGPFDFDLSLAIRQVPCDGNCLEYPQSPRGQRNRWSNIRVLWLWYLDTVWYCINMY